MLESVGPSSDLTGVPIKGESGGTPDMHCKNTHASKQADAETSQGRQRLTASQWGRDRGLGDPVQGTAPSDSVRLPTCRMETLNLS